MIKIVTMLHKGHKLQASELKTNMREREQRRVRRRSQVVREENTENEQTRKEKEKRQNKLKRDWGVECYFLHLHSPLPIYLGYFQLLSSDAPVSPHYRVAELAQTALSHLKCMLGCWRANKRNGGGRMR